MNHFDEFAKVLAGTMPRRTALLKIAGIAGGVLLGFFGLGKKASALTGAALVNCLNGCRGLPVLYRARCQLACQCAPRVLCGATAPICCPAGFGCVGGVCRGCTAGGMCGTFHGCPNVANANCFCGTSAEGSGFCALSDFCSNLTSCATTADCPAGRICLVNSCCPGGGGVCTLPCSSGTPALPALVQGGRTNSGR